MSYSEFDVSSTQNSLLGSRFVEVKAEMNGISSEPTCELAGSSSLNSLPGCSSLACLCEGDVPGAFLNWREPSQLHVGSSSAG